MSKRIGEMRFSDQKFSGFIATLAFPGGLNFNMISNPESDRSQDAPDFIIKAGKVELGVGWEKKSPAGVEYMSLQFDDPTWGDPINAAAFKQGGDDAYDIVWSRAKRSANSGQAASGADDEIPF